MGRFLDGMATTGMLMLGGILAYVIYRDWKIFAPGLGVAIAVTLWLGITILAAKDMEKS